MLNAASQLVHKVSYPLFLRAYYLKYLFSELEKEGSSRRQLGIRRFTDLDLRWVKRSDTLFILASGSSINKISPARSVAIYGTTVSASTFGRFAALFRRCISWRRSRLIILMKCSNSFVA